MTSAASPAEDGGGRRLRRHEVFITLLLVVGACATSWSSYQATRWNGEQAKAAGRTSALRVEASTAANLAAAQTQVDVATFIAWTDADRGGDPQLAEFYVDRFRPEFKTAFDAWVATEPFDDATAPKTPFAMDEYVVAAGEEAARLGTEAEASSAVVARNIQRSSNYVLTVVLYTLVLLFAGMAAKMSSRRLRTGVIVASFVLLLVALAWVSTFPVSVAV